MSDAGMPVDLPSPPPPTVDGHELVVDHVAPAISRDHPLVIPLPAPSAAAILPTPPRVHDPRPEPED